MDDMQQALLNVTKREYENAVFGLSINNDTELLFNLYHVSVAVTSVAVINARKHICLYLNEYETVKSADELKSHAHLLKDAIDELEK